MLTATEAKTSSIMHRQSLIADAIYAACRNGQESTRISITLTNKESARLNALGYLIIFHKGTKYVEASYEINWEKTKIIKWEDK
jgi:hypothetical protein